ncbi:MAG: UbiD family decarboxylase, partial [Bacillota bacterium]
MSSISPEIARLREHLQKAADIAEPFKRRMYALGVISAALAPRGIVPILVGGCAVEFYTLGSYATQDVDVVVSGRDEFDEVLRSLRFSKGTGQRHWYSEELDLAIEAPASVLAGSLERVVAVEVEGFTVHIIGLEDLLMDRLRAFVYWQSAADGEW